MGSSNRFCFRLYETAVPLDSIERTHTLGKCNDAQASYAVLHTNCCALITIHNSGHLFLPKEMCALFSAVGISLPLYSSHVKLDNGGPSASLCSQVE